MFASTHFAHQSNGVSVFYPDGVSIKRTISQQQAQNLLNRYCYEEKAVQIKVPSSLSPEIQRQLIASLHTARDLKEIDQEVFNICQLSKELEPEFYGYLIDELLGSPEEVVENTPENNFLVGSKIKYLLDRTDERIQFQDKEFYQAMSLVALDEIDAAEKILNSSISHQARTSLSNLIKSRVYCERPLANALVHRMETLCAYCL